MENIIIRQEEKKDWKNVEWVTRKAFWREDRIEKIGVGATEHYMVHRMRGNEGIKELTFVAEIQGKIVGHIIFSGDSYVLQPSGEKKPVLNFGPVSVLPKYQKQGIGSALLNYSVKRAKELGYGAIFFFGHPTYYPRFGFEDAKTFGITTSDGANFPAFMGMELQEGYLEGVSGKYLEPEIYNEERTKLPAKAYDLTNFADGRDPYK